MTNGENGVPDKPTLGKADSADGSRSSFDGFGEFVLSTRVWDWICSNATLRRIATNIFENLYSFFTKLPWIAAILIVVAILFRGLTEHVTVIQALSVPEALQKDGYTPEVAGHRLRDALQDFVKSADTHMSSPGLALHGELPDIVVPSVGISLDAIMSSLRTLLRIKRSRTLSGEFISEGDELLLRLRLDGRQIFTSQKVAGVKNPDQLLKLAAPEVLKEIQPYFIAVSLYNKGKSEDANAMADSIIARLPETDENVAWSYNLKGIISEKRENYPDAIDAYKKAIELNGRLVVAYVNFGNVYVDQGVPEASIEQYHKAIAIEPKYARAHFQLAAALHAIHEDDKAIAEYRDAIKYDQDVDMAHIGIGRILLQAGKKDEAIAEYRKAVKIDDQFPGVHYGFANELRKIGELKEAIAEYHRAIDLNPDEATYHRDLGFALRDIGSKQDAIVQLKEAVALDPNDETARAALAQEQPQQQQQQQQQEDSAQHPHDRPQQTRRQRARHNRF